MLSIFLYAYLITLYIRPQDWIGNPIYGFPVTDFIIIPALLFGLISKLIKKREIKVPQNYIMLVFVGLTFLTNMVNGHPDAASAQLLIFFKRFLIYLAILLNLDTPKKIRQFLFFSAILMVVLSFQGVSQRMTGTGWAMQRIHSRTGPMDAYEITEYASGWRSFWIGLWDGPNVLSLAYLGAFPFCLYNIFKKEHKIFSRLIYLALFILLYIGIYLTDSRGGFLTLILICGLFALFRYGKKVGIILLILVLPVILIFAPARMSELTTEESSAHQRTWLWEQGLNIARENPMFGVGKGQFPEVVGSKIISHSNYVENLAEMGFPGLIIYLALVYLAVKGCLIVYRKLSKDDRTHELLDLSRIVLLMLAGNIFATFFVVMEHDFLYVLWALAAAVFLIAKNEFKELKLEMKIKDWLNVGIIGVTLIYIIHYITENEIF